MVYSRHSKTFPDRSVTFRLLTKNFFNELLTLFVQKIDNFRPRKVRKKKEKMNVCTSTLFNDVALARRINKRKNFLKQILWDL